MFAGAGSVGKTSLMNACGKLATSRGLKTREYYSSTRESYAKAGLTNESDALKDPVFNAQFQHQVMKDNIETLYIGVANEAIGKNRPDLIIADRSPYDYAGYYMSVFNKDLTLAMIEQKRQQCDDSLNELMLQVKKINVIFLPYPSYWAVDTESSDGWRADKTGKNFIWSSVVEAEIQEAKRRFARIGIREERLEFNRLPSFMERGSPETRANGALAKVFPHL